MRNAVRANADIAGDHVSILLREAAGRAVGPGKPAIRRAPIEKTSAIGIAPDDPQGIVVWRNRHSHRVRETASGDRMGRREGASGCFAAVKDLVADGIHYMQGAS